VRVSIPGVSRNRGGRAYRLIASQEIGVSLLGSVRAALEDVQRPEPLPIGNPGVSSPIGPGTASSPIEETPWPANADETILAMRLSTDQVLSTHVLAVQARASVRLPEEAL
jgi:hypothetical protein